MSQQGKIIGAISPTFFRLENSPHRLLWLAHNTSWMAPEWILPWGEGSAPEVPHVSGRRTTYLQAMGLKEQYKMLDQARREVNDYCINLIKKDVEHRKSQRVESLFQDDLQCPSPFEIRVEAFLHLWDVYLTVAELSREMKMELMQDMLISSRYALEQFRLKRPNDSMPPLGTRIFTIAKPFCLGSESGYMDVEVEPKKFSKYFHFLATF